MLDHYGVRYANRHSWQKVLCPFHDEREPSCSIDLEGGFNCHACQAQGGDAYAFVMLKENVDFPTAKRLVAEITGHEAHGAAMKPGSRPGRRGGFRPHFGKTTGE